MRSGRGLSTLPAPILKASDMPTADEWDRALRIIRSRSRGSIDVIEREPLAQRTTLRIGGPARALACCRDRDAVALCLATLGACRLPWLVLGMGGNVLVPDEGIDALVIVLEGELSRIERQGARFVAGGGLPLAKLVRETIDAGLTGLECLGGIPSTVGGALAGNTGAYGQEALDVLNWAEVVEGDGTVRRLERWEIEGGYRWSVLGKGRIVTSAEFALKPDRAEALAERVREARERRRSAIPAEPSAGSVFRNPPGDYAGRLLDLAGCKGMREGGAMVSERHANVVVNVGGATAVDVRRLVAAMARRVREQFALDLELELKVLKRDGSVSLAAPCDLA